MKLVQESILLLVIYGKVLKKQEKNTVFSCMIKVHYHHFTYTKYGPVTCW